MANGLIPPNSPNDADSDSASDGTPEYKSPATKQEDFDTTHHNFFEKAKPVLIVVGFMAFVECASVFFEHLAGITGGFFRSVFHWVSLCGQLLVVTIPISKWFRTKWKVWTVFSIACALMGLLAFKNPALEPKLYAHLGFGLSTSLDPEKITFLTNDFLIASNPKEYFVMKGAVFVPIPIESSNATLNFFVVNDDSNDAKNVEIFFEIGTNFNSLMHTDWVKTTPRGINMANEKTNVLKMFSYNLPIIHNGDGSPLPPIFFRDAPMSLTIDKFPDVREKFIIVARVENAPVQAIAAELYFVPFFQNVLYKPFVLPARLDSNGHAIYRIFPKEFLETQKN